MEEFLSRQPGKQDEVTNVANLGSPFKIGYFTVYSSVEIIQIIYTQMSVLLIEKTIYQQLSK